MHDLPRSATARLRWSAACISLAVFGFLLPLGGLTKPQFLTNRWLTIVAGVFSVLSCSFLLLGSSRSKQSFFSTRGTILAGVYLVYLSGTTLTRSVPSQRLQLFAISLVGLYCFYCLESRKPGIWTKVVYTICLTHLAQASLFGYRVTVESGASRLTNGSSPVFLGFESALVVLLAIFYFQRCDHSPLCKALQMLACLVGVYVLFASFSRSAIISLAFAMVLLVVFRRRNLRSIVAVYASGAILILALFTLPNLIDFLGGNDVASVYNASGRYEIWSRLLRSDLELWRGYGFAALYGPLGPDWYLYALNQGLPAENSLLQALLMGGYVAAVLWFLLFAAAIRYLFMSRTLSGGVSVGLISVISIEAVYGIGMSSVSTVWWSLLLCFSICDSVSARALDSKFPTDGGSTYGAQQLEYRTIDARTLPVRREALWR